MENNKDLQTKRITRPFLQRNSEEFFTGKEALLKRNLTNISMETIPEGSIVTIIGKNKDLPKSCLDIKHEESGIEIDRVFCDSLELITE